MSCPEFVVSLDVYRNVTNTNRNDYQTWLQVRLSETYVGKGFALRSVTCPPLSEVHWRTAFERRSVARFMSGQYSGRYSVQIRKMTFASRS